MGQGQGGVECNKSHGSSLRSQPLCNGMCMCPLHCTAGTELQHCAGTRSGMRRHPGSATAAAGSQASITQLVPVSLSIWAAISAPNTGLLQRPPPKNRKTGDTGLAPAPTTLIQKTAAKQLGNARNVANSLHVLHGRHLRLRELALVGQALALQNMSTRGRAWVSVASETAMCPASEGVRFANNKYTHGLMQQACALAHCVQGHRSMTRPIWQRVQNPSRTAQQSTAQHSVLTARLRSSSWRRSLSSFSLVTTTLEGSTPTFTVAPAQVGRMGTTPCQEECKKDDSVGEQQAWEGSKPRSHRRLQAAKVGMSVAALAPPAGRRRRLRGRLCCGVAVRAAHTRAHSCLAACVLVPRLPDPCCRGPGPVAQPLPAAAATWRLGWLLLLSRGCTSTWPAAQAGCMCTAACFCWTAACAAAQLSRGQEGRGCRRTAASAACRACSICWRQPYTACAWLHRHVHHHVPHAAAAPGCMLASAIAGCWAPSATPPPTAPGTRRPAAVPKLPSSSRVPPKLQLCAACCSGAALAH